VRMTPVLVCGHHGSCSRSTNFIHVHSLPVLEPIFKSINTFHNRLV